MSQNYFTFLAQAINELLTTRSASIQFAGLNIYRGLVVIMLVWFGLKAALSATQGLGGFHFARFADLILMLSFGFGMLTYYSTPIPGMQYSFSDLVTKEAIQLSSQIQTDNVQKIANSLNDAEEQLGDPPGLFSMHEEINYWAARTAVIFMQCIVFAVVGYGYIATAVCVLVGPIFIPWFIVPKMDWLFWGWFKAFIGFSFYQVVASAYVFVFSQILTGIFKTIGTLNLSRIGLVLPALVGLTVIGVYGALKIPELSASILGGRSGTWVDFSGRFNRD